MASDKRSDTADDQTSQAANQHADKNSTSSDSYKRLCLCCYALSFVIFGSQVSILGPTIKALASHLKVSEPDLSPVFTALGVSCIVSGTPSGWVVDRYPTHIVLAASLIIEAMGFALVPLMPSVWSLSLLYFVTCFTFNFTNSAVFTSLAWMFPKRAGPGINLVLAMFGVGSFFIPLIALLSGIFLHNTLTVYWIIGALAAVFSIPFFFLQSPSKPPPQAPHRSGTAHERHISRSLEIIVTVSIVSLVFMTTCAETAIGNWVFTYANTEVGLSNNQSAYANSAFWLAFTVGRVFAAFLSHMTTPLMLLLCSCPFSILGACIPIIIGKANMSFYLVIAVASLTGFGNSTIYANAVALLEHFVPVTGFINGIFGAVAGGACMIGPVLTAQLAKYTPMHFSAVMVVGLVFYVMHIPCIVCAFVSGSRLKALTKLDLHEPLLQQEEGSAPASAPAPMPTTGAPTSRPMSVASSAPMSTAHWAETWREIRHEISHSIDRHADTPMFVGSVGVGGLKWLSSSVMSHQSRDEE